MVVRSVSDYLTSFERMAVGIRTVDAASIVCRRVVLYRAILQLWVAADAVYAAPIDSRALAYSAAHDPWRRERARDTSAIFRRIAEDDVV